MKKYIPIGLSILILINIICLFYIVKTTHNVKSVVENYKVEIITEISKETKKVDEVFSDIKTLKDVIGWKTTRLNDTYCLGSNIDLINDAFSFTTKDESGCYLHEFNKLNELYKSLELDFKDGKFDAYVNKLKNEAYEALRKYGPIAKDVDQNKIDQLKSIVKDVLK